MTRIGVVTDSSCDLPAGVAADLGVGIVPLTIRFGDNTFTDGVDLDKAAFWQRLGQADHLPETAAPSPGAFLTAFEALGDVDGIVCVCISSRLSGTYQAAVIAAEEASVPVRVVDSDVVSMALGLVVMETARSAAAGHDLERVSADAAGAASRANVIAALDTLEYLEKGGRVGRVSALLGGLLDIKPLITLEDGAVAAAGRQRTRAKALAAVAEQVAGHDIAALALVHSDAANIDRLKDTLAASAPHLDLSDPLVAELGPVVGTHTGPGVLGVAFLVA